jgi:hypothetical protein
MGACGVVIRVSSRFLASMSSLISRPPARTATRAARPPLDRAPSKVRLTRARFRPAPSETRGMNLTGCSASGRARARPCGPADGQFALPSSSERGEAATFSDSRGALRRSMPRSNSSPARRPLDRDVPPPVLAPPPVPVRRSRRSSIQPP